MLEFHRIRISRHHVLLFFILLFAFTVRVWAIDFGLPGKFRPDEEHIVNVAVGMQKGHFNPHMFVYGGLLPYLTGFFLFLVTYLGSVTTFVDQKDLLEFFLDHQQAPVYVLGRFVVSLFGVLTVLAMYYLGKAVRDRTLGIVAATVLATSFIHCRDSHFLTPDVPCGLFVTLTLISLVKLCRRGSRVRYFTAAVCAGLAIGTKYTASALAIPIFVAHTFYFRLRGFSLWGWGLRSVLYLSGAVVVSTLVFLLTSPYTIIAHKEFLQWLRVVHDNARHGLTCCHALHGWSWTLNYLVVGVSLPIFLLVLANFFVTVYTLLNRDVGLVSCRLSFFSLLIGLLIIYSQAKWIPIRCMVILSPVTALLLLRCFQPKSLCSCRTSARHSLFALNDYKHLTLQQIQDRRPF